MVLPSSSSCLSSSVHLRPTLRGVDAEVVIKVANINQQSPHTIIVAMANYLLEHTDGKIPQEFVNEILQRKSLIREGSSNKGD